MANPERLAVLNQGVEAWNSWRQEFFRNRWQLGGPDTWNLAPETCSSVP